MRVQLLLNEGEVGGAWRDSWSDTSTQQCICHRHRQHRVTARFSANTRYSSPRDRWSGRRPVRHWRRQVSTILFSAINIKLNTLSHVLQLIDIDGHKQLQVTTQHCNKINNNHLLFNLLPPPSTSSQNYNLRTRPHSQLLLNELDISLLTSLQECFSKTFIFLISIVFFLLMLCYEIAFCEFSIKRILDWIW